MLKNNREHLKPLVKNVYMNKLKVKRYSPYIYAGERNEEYFNLRYFQTNNRIKLGHNESNSSDRRMILGIESSFDDTAAGIVTPGGSVLANCKRRLTGEKFDMKDAPIKA